MDTVSHLRPHLLAFAMDFVRLCLWLLILMIVFVPLERLFALHPRKVFRKAWRPEYDGSYYVRDVAAETGKRFVVGIKPDGVSLKRSGIITFET